ncbi:Gag-Pol polyprotein [Labeo rohita]|uniref:Gag-Pol polyprotein n=1 Tax=Labeo rohita TaxID=84645 RepID=A0ABQ8L3M4_LABRO|nr:Gag-Pol polyprotein [Labeo rohita]
MAKRYGVIFTCMASRAVHLEVAYSLSTDSCINAIRRFVCRRGQIQSLRSDNGTNFVGAARELKEALAAIDHGKIHGVLLKAGIDWIFNTPGASHHGGVWERLIRMVKRVLHSALQQQLLDDESLPTILCEIEAILNDRPITKVSDDINDLEALTPNHILLLKGKPSLAPGLFQESDLYIRRQWRQVQYLSDLFWKRWIREYLPLLQERQKWTKPRRNFVTGDIVIVMDHNTPRGSWVMGRVIRTYPDKKGFVRSVQLKTKTGQVERPISKLFLLQEAV